MSRTRTATSSASAAARPQANNRCEEHLTRGNANRLLDRMLEYPDH